MILAPQAEKRWCDRAERWARPGALFQPDRYGVAVVPERDAKALIHAHHYSGTFPAARLSVGLFRKDGPAGAARLAGVAVFSVPMNQHAVTSHAEVEAHEGVELGRFVCLPEVAFNGESWFLARAFQCLQSEKTDVRAVLSYADPLERRSAAGAITKPAHAGTIYQASNAAFLGRARARWLWVARDGSIVSERALTKIRAQDQGHLYAARQLESAGAAPRRRGEEPGDWLDRVLREPTFRKLRHPGNLVYVFGLDRAARRAAGAKSKPYLKLNIAA